MLATAIDAVAEPPEYTEAHSFKFNNGNICYITPPEEESAANLKTGVYENTTPPTLIYEFPYDYFSHTQYYFTKDGLNHVEYDAFSYEEDYDEAALGIYSVIKFYEKGKLIKQYYPTDLLKNIKSGALTSEGFQWSSDYNQGGRVNYVNNILYVDTREDIRIVFDMKTGEIISRGPRDTEAEPTILVGSRVAIIGYGYYKEGANGFEYAGSVPYRMRCVSHEASQISDGYALINSANGVDKWVELRYLVKV